MNKIEEAVVSYNHDEPGVLDAICINDKTSDVPNYDDAGQVMEKRFIQFLKDEGVYDSFIHNLSHSHPGVTLEEYLLTSSYTTSLVSCAFIWYGTKEDHLFWKGIDKKWRKFCGQLTEA